MGTPPPQMQTFGLRQRQMPRTRLARCEEVECPQHIHGWRTRLAVTDTARLALVASCGRHYTEKVDGEFVEFTFPPGQQCFAEHWTEKTVLYVVRGHRKGEAAGVPWQKHSGPDPWLDQFQDNQDRLAAQQRAQG